MRENDQNVTDYKAGGAAAPCYIRDPLSGGCTNQWEGSCVMQETSHRYRKYEGTNLLM